MEIARKPRRQRLDHVKRGRRTVQLADSDRAVQRDHRRRLQPLERRIQRVDLRPVGVVGTRGAGVQWRRLPPAPDRARAGDGASPCRSAPGPRRSACRPTAPRSWSSSSTISPSASNRAGSARVLQQHQRGEPHDLRLGLEQAQQQARQPDRFIAQIGARAARRLRRIALVEHADRSSRQRRRGVRRVPTRPAPRMALRPWRCATWRA